jgi:hypothetical protein
MSDPSLIVDIMAATGTLASVITACVRVRASACVRRARHEACRDIVRDLTPGSRVMMLDGENIIIDVGSEPDHAGDPGA